MREGPRLAGTLLDSAPGPGMGRRQRLRGLAAVVTGLFTGSFTLALQSPQSELASPNASNSEDDHSTRRNWLLTAAIFRFAPIPGP